MSEDQLTHATKAALNERVKELTCLYGIAQIAGRPGACIEDILQEISEHLPNAWQYPDIATARITLEGASYASPQFHESQWKQSSDIIVGGLRHGVVEIAYGQARPDSDEGPFLKEERNLIDEVARQIGFIIERQQVEEERLKLRDQLRHADRLATIGMLAAGVAHELNEPIGNVLGFAQLAMKCPELPTRAMQDIEKIETASLNARDIIKKLLVFARQTPPDKQLVNLNEVVKSGLHFFEARCERQGIEIVRLLSADLPEITADASQLNQVLINLVVNSLQAMPSGGKLTVQTEVRGSDLLLAITDTGVGMGDEVLKQIFLPFFTTKDVGHGTGLGLPVVHGIVTSHGGSIEAKSVIGRGSRFEIRLPRTRADHSKEALA